MSSRLSMEASDDIPFLQTYLQEFDFIGVSREKRDVIALLPAAVDCFISDNIPL